MARVPSPGTDEDAPAPIPEDELQAEEAASDPVSPAALDADGAAEDGKPEDGAPARAREGEPDPEPTRRGPRHAAPGGRARHRTRAHRRWPIVAGVVAAALAAGVVVQLVRPVPAPSVTLAVPARVVVPGAAPAVPWPATGQGAFAVPALGMARQSGPETPVPVASLTKMMTAYLVLHAHPLAVSDQGPTITLSAADAAEAKTEQAAGDASVPVSAGETLTERQLLDGMLVPSADNFADILATWVAGSTATFVSSMNATAAALGMRSTHYADTSGLDPSSVSTAADSLRLASADMAIPAFAAVVDQPTTTLPQIGTVHNFVRSIGVDGIVGVKSGYTEAAKGCLVLAANRVVGGRTVLVLAAVNGQSGADPHAAADAAARAVLDAAGGALTGVAVVAGHGALAVEQAPWGASAPMVARGGVVVVGWPGDVVSVRVGLLAPTRPGATPGGRATVVVTDGAEHTSVVVTATRPVSAPSLLWRLLHG